MCAESYNGTHGVQRNQFPLFVISHFTTSYLLFVVAGRLIFIENVIILGISSQFTCMNKLREPNCAVKQKKIAQHTQGYPSS